MRSFFRILLVLCLIAASTGARAELALLLNASTGKGMTRYTASGHAAVYLSRVCAETPVKLRLCNPGEEGVVINNYASMGEDQPYEWNAYPLSVFLYGVEDPADRPLFASHELRFLLQERFRRRHLAGLCSSEMCAQNLNTHWRDGVAATFVREVNMFQVHTTVEQDERFVAWFNARPNINRYNGFTRNCADFAKAIVNFYFPHSARRNLLNDFGMTSPKAIARSFTHYGRKRLEMGLVAIRIPQLPGTFPRSSDCREGTEVAFRSKKWLFPMLLKSNELGLFITSYVLTGRFNPAREVRRLPSPEAADLRQQIALAESAQDQELAASLNADLEAERRAVLGTDTEWRRYREQLKEVLHGVQSVGAVESNEQPRKMFEQLAKDGTEFLDENGAPWMRMGSTGHESTVGLGAANILSPRSDRELALKILLARLDALLSSKAKNRETWPQLVADWELLGTARLSYEDEQRAAKSVGSNQGRE